MSDVKRLLAERLQYHLGDVVGDDPDWEEFATRLAEEIGLPDYEAAVEALERLVDQFDNYDPAGTGYTGFSVEPARAALARLREPVPA